MSVIYKLYKSCSGERGFNPFIHDRSLDQTKLKAFADDKVNETKMIISALDRVENVGIGDIDSKISPFPTMFSKGFFPRLSKGIIVWECVNPFPHNDAF